MPKVKITIWGLVIGSLGAIIFQNRDFFFPGHAMALDLVFTAYTSPRFPVAVWFISFFLLGWLLAYLFGLSDRFRATREKREHQRTINTQQQAIDALKADVEALKQI
ncbi:MAG: LapA family protein [Desulfatitalea sp.]|nr:DUF1049 domain-containing protein [Desulfatitalea sp.]NNK01974.1 LapA family protein [Desulfatitalea sp.]